jgi:hypothetical protein
VSEGDPTLVLVTGSGATSFLWNPLVGEIVLRGHRALPVELPGHGFDTVSPAGYGSPRGSRRVHPASAPGWVAPALALRGLLDPIADRVMPARASARCPPGRGAQHAARPLTHTGHCLRILRAAPQRASRPRGEASRSDPALAAPRRLARRHPRNVHLGLSLTRFRGLRTTDHHNFRSSEQATGPP